MSAHYHRASLLYAQERYDMAEAELRQGLAADPNDAYSHALLGLCLCQQKRYKDAQSEAEHAIHLGPDIPFTHYALASVLEDRNDFDPALRRIEEALRLDPSQPDFHALQAQIFLSKHNWARTLEAAERGLQLDPEHVQCTNLRAIALVRLGRRSEAGLTIDAALARNPENSVTHANQGWTYLHGGNAEKALEHFRESLRLDPNNEWARQGIVEALKARNIVYAMMLKYFLWMSRLPPRTQWLVVLGGYFGNRILGALGDAHPALYPWVLPIRILYLVFVFLTWTADPLFNLLLRLNRFGRLVLSREEIVASNWIGTLVFLAIVSLCFWIPTQTAVFALGGFVFGFSVIPLAAVFKCQQGWPRQLMILYTAVMLAVGLGAISLGIRENLMHIKLSPELGGLFKSLFSIFIIGVIAAPWVANTVIMIRPRRR